MRRQPEHTVFSTAAAPAAGLNLPDIASALGVSPEPGLLVDDQGRVVVANSKAHHLFGYDEHMLQHISVERVLLNQRDIISEDWASFNFHFQPAWELLGISRAGKLFPVEVCMSLVPAGAGSLLWLSIRPSGKRLPADARPPEPVYTKNLINVSSDAVVVIDAAGKIADVNTAAVVATGMSREHMPGTEFASCFTDPQLVEEAVRQALIHDFVTDVPLILKHRHKKMLFSAAVCRQAGDEQFLLATLRDITFHQKQEVEIKSLTDELWQRIAELESFSYSVSHDLQAPLRAIDGFIAIFLTKYLEQMDAEGKRLLDNVRHHVDKMACLIDELLMLSRIGMADIEITPINMQMLTQAVLQELTEQKGKARVVVKELPPASGDLPLIRQVMVNLISNAFKYSGKKDTPEVEIGAHELGGENHYYIKDNGVGFDMAYADKLFGVFQRLHEAGEYQGTGVGLAIVKRIINRHGGKVWAEGRENEGATFFFSLKRTDGNQETH